MNRQRILNVMAPIYQPGRLIPKIGTVLDKFMPLGDLLLRCWMAYAFWVSGLIKAQNWNSTLYLFENEYSVPLLPADFAALLGTAVELGGPVLLAVGLFGRGAAALLFLFNIIAVISYPDLGAAGIEQHKVWGIMLLVSLFIVSLSFMISMTTVQAGDIATKTFNTSLCSAFDQDHYG